jgi:hypothetical protein
MKENQSSKDNLMKDVSNLSESKVVRKRKTSFK